MRCLKIQHACLWTLILSGAFVSETLGQNGNVQQLISLGDAAFNRGEYASADRYLRSALDAAEAQHAPPNQMALALANMAQVLTVLGQYPDAEQMFERAVPIVRELKDPDPSFLEVFLTNMGSLYRILGKYDKAEAALTEVQKVAARNPGSANARMPLILSDLAALYVSTNRSKLAEATLKKALDLTPSDNTAIVRISLDLAGLYIRQQKFSEAQRYCTQALEAAQRLSGPNHPDAAAALFGLGRLHAQQKKPHEAENEFRRAKEILSIAFGPKHLAVAIAGANVAAMLTAQGRYDDAELEYKDALAIQNGHQDQRSAQLAGTLEGYAVLLRLKTEQDAKAMEVRARSIRTELKSKVEVSSLGEFGSLPVAIPDSK
jgi:tetratricopeptide (TPR) repeat protein